MNGELELVTYPPYTRSKQEGPNYPGSVAGDSLRILIFSIIFPPLGLFIGTMTIMERLQLRRRRNDWQCHQDELIKTSAVTEAENITAEAV